jgi:hypothetical protein
MRRMKMTKLICPSCGNIEEFSRVAYGTARYSEVHVLDGDFETLDYFDYEEHNNDIDDYDDVKCETCHQIAREFEYEKEWVEFRVKHTKLNGEWSIEELPEEEQKSEIRLEYIAEQI